jgi:hypothetical protein
MDEQDYFRLGFLTWCAERGMKPDEIRSMVKQANNEKSIFSGLLPSLGKNLWYAGEQIVPWFASAPFIIGGAGLGAAAVGGAGLGYGAAKLTEREASPELAKKYELIATLRQQAEQARRNAERARYRTRN